MSLTIKDGSGSTTTLKTFLDTGEHVPHHKIDGTVTITSSLANPVAVTGTLTVNTASSVSISNFPTSQYVTSSAANPIWVTGSTVVDVVIGDLITVTASAANPVSVTGTVLVGNSSLSVTSSQANPVYVSHVPVSTVSNSAVTSFDWSTSASGTFQIATSDAARKSLSIFNPGPSNLYVVYSTSGGATNGFVLTNTASAPSQYSFIIYPSGTYISEQCMASVYHGGYFISGSASSGVFISSIS